jgi:inosine/xanthosine triphosphate pyrophosphatase family protein
LRSQLLENSAYDSSTSCSRVDASKLEVDSANAAPGAAAAVKQQQQQQKKKKKKDLLPSLHLKGSRAADQ